MDTAVITVNLTNTFIDSLFEILKIYNTALELDEFHRNERRDFIRELLEEDNPHYLYIENAGTSDSGELNVNLIYATDCEINSRIVGLIGMRTLQISGILKPDGLLLRGCFDLPEYLGMRNNRRKLLELEFELESYGVPTLFYPSVISEISGLPDARRQSRIVEKRMKNWDIYLKLAEEKAEAQKAILKYDGYRISESKYIHLNLKGSLDILKGKNLRQAAARVGKQDHYKDEDELVDHLELIGSYLNLNTSTREVKIELSDESQELVMLNDFWIPKQGMLHLSKMGDLVQTRRLQSGLKRLTRGKAINPNIENILFDDKPIVNNRGNGYIFHPQDMLRTDLNKYQKEAVRKALASQDIFLIQGPPGTGKTTVIAEICYQNAIRGLKTLIASQSNLAVDNALSKLVHHPKIRALRKGNASRVEDEGKPFTEERVIDTWMDSTAHACREEIADLSAELEKVKMKRQEIKKSSVKLHGNCSAYQEEIEKIGISIDQLKQDMLQISKLIDMRKTDYLELTRTLQHYENSKVELETALKDLPLQRENLFNHLSVLEDQLKNQLVVQKQNEQYLNEIKFQIQNQEETQILREAVKEESMKLQTDAAYLKVTINPLKKGIKDQTTELSTLTYYHDRSMRTESSDQIIELVESMVANVSKIGPAYREEVSIFKEEMRKASQSIQHNPMYKSLLTEVRELQRTLNIELNKHSIQIDEEVKEINSKLTPSHFILDRLRRDLSGLLKAKPSKWTSLIGGGKKWKSQLLHLGNEIYQLTNTAESIVEELNRLELQAQKAERNYFNYIHRIYPSILTTLRGEIAAGKERLIALKEAVQGKEKELQEIESKLPPLSRKLIQLQGNNITQLRKEKNDRELQLQRLGVAIQLTREQVIQGTQKAHSQVEKIDQTYMEKEMELQSFHSLAEDLVKQLQSVRFSNEELEDMLSQKGRSLKNLEQELANILIREKEVTVTTKKLEVLYKELGEKERVQDVRAEILLEWIERLEKKEERDKTGLKQIYIDSANVIGITCVQSGSLQFSEEYPDFDVVIIDEVSKATPPEILLPMLKGKKIILVGDHKQLPPMIGDDTLNEVIENGAYTHEEKDEMKNYLKESLFERLFHSFDNSLKETLRIQYRMHPQIMQTINQFYRDYDGLGLICGLDDPDKVREHRIDGKLIRKGQHILWLDTPLHPSHYEKQAEGGTSFYNETEIHMILGALTEINDSLQKQKESGLLELAVRKEVGIISFYGEQVKRLQHLVLGDKEKYNHLSIRVGTVDRFQGMERDIILASFVRNNSRGDIGFAKEYKRVNVAMSRAKELLIITGCSELFCYKSQKRYPKAAEMYSNILNEIEKVNGHVDILGRSLVKR